MNLTLTGIDVLVIYIVTSFAVIQSIIFTRWNHERHKRRLVMNFMASMQERIETEEEFNAIVNKFRKDFEEDDE